MALLTRYLPFASGVTSVQASTYLLFVCLFSISFLVFLNSSVSFVITDLLALKDGVGDLVGTLGFADELVALVACPLWGIMSDRVGVRWVCFLGYLIVGLSLLVFVQARNVYPQLLLARMAFSVGGAATATMVTAILPSMTGDHPQLQTSTSRPRRAVPVPSSLRHSITPSVDSQMTITPEIYTNTRSTTENGEREGQATNATASKSVTSSPSRLAGLVGVFTGCGALVALAVFLPLPAQFSHLKGISQGQAVADSFYVVGAIAVAVSLACFFGLRGLQGEEGKGWRLLLSAANANVGHGTETCNTRPVTFLPYWRLLLDSTLLGFKDAQIGLGYLGGFVARASSVGISLFIPLYINAYFIRNGFCQGAPSDPSPELKKECRAAYVLAAELTGVSQLIALLCAPAFGYLSDRYRRFNVPLLVASVFGIVGYTAFAQLKSPEVKDIDGRGGSAAVFLIVACIGISQIGAIVCSLGLLGRGVLGAEEHDAQSEETDQRGDRQMVDGTAETEPLLESSTSTANHTSRSHLKGSIAGVYSLSGGAAILLLTKLGGYLFDTVSVRAPFYMMSIFNAVLFVGCLSSGVYREVRRKQHHQ